MDTETRYNEALLSRLQSEAGEDILDEAELREAKAKFLARIAGSHHPPEDSTDPVFHVVPSPLPPGPNSEPDSRRSTKPPVYVGGAVESTDVAATTPVNEPMAMAADTSKARKRRRETRDFGEPNRCRRLAIQEVEGGIRLIAIASDPADLNAVACWTIGEVSGELVLQEDENGLRAESELLPIPFDMAVSTLALTWR